MDALWTHATDRPICENENFSISARILQGWKTLSQNCTFITRRQMNYSLSTDENLDIVFVDTRFYSGWELDSDWLRIVINNSDQPSLI